MADRAGRTHADRQLGIPVIQFFKEPVEQRVRDLAPGAVLDYTDPAEVATEYEYQCVDELVPETKDCTLVHFQNLSFGMPPGGMVTVVGYETEYQGGSH